MWLHSENILNEPCEKTIPAQHWKNNGLREERRDGSHEEKWEGDGSQEDSTLKWNLERDCIKNRDDDDAAAAAPH